MIADNNQLYQSNLSKNDSWTEYLATFEEGTNPTYLTNTVHDCNCCKSFIRSIGGLLAYVDNELVSIWDISIPGRYQVVVDALSSSSKAAGIADIFLHDTKVVGGKPDHITGAMKISGMLHPESASAQAKNSIRSIEMITYDHFYAELPSRVVVGPKASKSIATQKAEARTNKEGLMRGLTEISQSAVEVVSDLIDSKQLLQATKARATINRITRLINTPPEARTEQFYWQKSLSLGLASKFHNSSLGVLLTAITKGEDITESVNAYNKMVDPANFKRSKSVITPAMQKKTAEFIKKDGCADSLPRRAAKLSDITINNLRYASSQVKESLGVLDVLNDVVKRTTPDLKNVPTIDLEGFMHRVLPRSKTIEMLVTGELKNNFMSLVAPVNPDAPSILAWDNNFSHVYDGDLTDVSQIKENVKAAGGNVEGDFRASLSWNEGNSDRNIDLDAHLVLGTGTHIYHGNRYTDQRTGGYLDVDNTRPGNKIAVENITYPKVGRMRDTTYKVYVRNYSSDTCKEGFKFEIELLGDVYSYWFNSPIPGGVNIDVATVTLKKGVFTIKHHLEPTSVDGGNKWGVSYDEFTPVKAIMDSPNYWDDNHYGEPHVLFMLDGCINPDPVRGLFTEFLHPRFHNDRKTFEILGHKLRAPFSEDQLSGIGVSANVHPIICFKVDTDKGTQLYNVQF